MSYDKDDPFDMGVQFVRTAELNKEGDTVSGVIVGAEKVHDRKYDMANPGKGPLLYWSENGSGVTETPNDTPVMYSMFIVQAFEASDDDDGRRGIRANKPRLKEAIKKAIATSGAARMGLGGHLTVTMTGFIPGKGSSQAKGWAATYFTPEQVAEGKVPEQTEPKQKPAPKDDDPFA